jgi:hypothetical protein
LIPEHADPFLFEDMLETGVREIVIWRWSVGCDLVSSFSDGTVSAGAPRLACLVLSPYVSGEPGAVASGDWETRRKRAA